MCFPITESCLSTRIFDYSDVLENNGQTSGQPYCNRGLLDHFTTYDCLAYSLIPKFIGFCIRHSCSWYSVERQQRIRYQPCPPLHIPLTPNFGNRFSHPHSSYNHGVSWCTEHNQFLFMRYA